MNTYHITRIVREEYMIEAANESEATRKLNRAKPKKVITEKQEISANIDAPIYADIYSPPGTKVKAYFIDGKIKNGYDHDIAHSMKYLKPGVVYEVDRTNVHSWHTTFYLKEFPGIPFSSVHFLKAE